MIPVGVQGSGAGLPSTSQPRLVGCSPSTSFSGSTAARIANSSNPVGCWTRNAVQAGSAFSSAITASTSAWVAVAGRSRRMLFTPMAAESLCFALTYHWLAGSSPTRTVPSPGTMPRSASAATRSVSSLLIAVSVALPSRIVAVTRPSCQAHPDRFARARRARSDDDDAEGGRQLDALVTVDPGPVEVGPPRVEAVEQGAVQIGVLEIRVVERDAAQVGPDQVGVVQIGLRQVGRIQADVGEIDAGEVGTGQR